MTAALLTLALAAAPAEREFVWDIPEEISRTEVDGIMVAAGLPMKMYEVRSKWPMFDLFKHFLKSFDDAGFFVPSWKHQLKMKDGAVQITALDTRRLLAYTVVMRPSEKPRGTTILLSTTNWGAPQATDPGDTFAPVFPGAEKLATLNVEAAQVLTYRTRAQPEELKAYYRDVLGSSGYRTIDGQTFQKDGDRIHVEFKASDDRSKTVVVVSKNFSMPEEP